jgi:protein TonB
VNPAAAPIEAPREIKPEPPPRLMSVVGGIPTNLPAAASTAALGAAPPPAAPVRVGGDIKRPEIVKKVDPIYPPIAKAARVAGMVIIEAIIARDGTIKNAKVIRSVPMLDQAALDAVNQWRYTPTLLNNQPVEVIMSVNVTFAIQ